MNVLVLEDNPERQQYFRDRFPGCVVVATYAAALAAFMGARRYDEVYLDHDIEFGHNGCDVAYWMTSLPRAQWPARVVVHSSNVRGSLAIAVTLRNAGFRVEQRPFPPNTGLDPAAPLP